VDDTLVCHSPNSSNEIERWPKFIHRLFGEPLRLGTRERIAKLRQRGCSIWIYTTSERTPSYIWLWLFLYGIRVNGVVNDERHRRELVGRSFARLPSKYPPAFRIDLHIDDSEGVLLEGSEHGFHVLVISPDDPFWTQKVLDAVERFNPQQLKSKDRWRAFDL
jgi:hypothetical protein